jgi:hypothetical protein
MKSRYFVIVLALVTIFLNARTRAERSLIVPTIRIYNGHPSAPVGEAQFDAFGKIYLSNLSNFDQTVTVNAKVMVYTLMSAGSFLPSTPDNLQMKPKNIFLKAKGTSGDRQTVDILVHCPWMLGNTRCKLDDASVRGSLKSTSGMDVSVYFFLELQVKEDRGAVVSTFSGNSIITGGFRTTTFENPTL